MQESLKISQNQQMTQRLSPRQVMYARLLEMTAPEIEEEVRRQLDDNPALEMVEPVDYEDAPAPEGESSDSSADIGDGNDRDLDDDPADYPATWQSGSETTQWQIAADAPDLLTSLNQQLGQIDLTDDQRKICTYIIGNIDENGYITRTLQSMADDLAIAGVMDADMAQMRQAFDVVRSLDPAGVGAVDLRDCLLLQLQRRQQSTLALRIAREIVADYFDLLSKKHFDRLQAQLGLQDREELRKALLLIRSCNPKPGSAIAPSASTMRIGHIAPDVVVEDLGEGRMAVSLAGFLPNLAVERTFVLDSAEKPRNKGEREAQAFIKLKRDDAETFIGALRQRGSTLLQVTEAIVRRQEPFFASGGDQAQLRPMILKDIASDTGYDISVISRATAGKYLATDMGVYPLKMFFNEAPNDQNDASSHQLMDAIAKIVAAEDKRRPMSDLAILQAMEKQGYKMARRTVTKYREKLGLPVARLRKND